MLLGRRSKETVKATRGGCYLLRKSRRKSEQTRHTSTGGREGGAGASIVAFNANSARRQAIIQQQQQQCRSRGAIPSSTKYSITNECSTIKQPLRSGLLHATKLRRVKDLVTRVFLTRLRLTLPSAPSGTTFHLPTRV